MRPAIRKATQRRSGRPQIRDVARLAGVSAITVSRYINDPEKVAKGTSEKIAKAIKRSGYIPNMLAKGLSSNRSNVVAAIIPTITNSIFADLVSGLSDRLEENGYRLLIAENDYSLEREAELIRTMIGQRPAALVVTGQLHTKEATDLLRGIEIPVLECFETGAEPIDMCAGFSNFDACFQMVSGLIDAGYRKIGFVSAPVAENDRATHRRNGYLTAMKKTKRKVRRGWMREAKFSFREGAAALSALVDEQPELEAIFFASDVLSIGAVMECQRRRIRFPDDIGICGFDDLELTAMTSPPLTTVRVPRYEIGQQSAAMLMARLNGDQAVERTVDLGFEVVWRGSTRHPS